MKVRGLFFILIMVFACYLIFFNQSNFLAYLIVAVLIGWGADYFLGIVLERMKTVTENKTGKSKILDSSVIIDGRILDIIEAEFIEGDIVIPKFVLEELQYLADSEDGMKRARGRRGLDLIKVIQSTKRNNVVINDTDYKIKEVDAKLIQLAKDIQGDVITTDYNLNKVATIQGIKVLNINKLSNALKPVVIPNEELFIELIKAGDRDGQAVGYLNDGTMVVAEDGKEFLGRSITLLVTSVYPTAAGRMIFGRVKRK